MATPQTSFSKRASGEMMKRPDQAQAGPGEVPGWKRALDLSCIVLSLPGWLPIMLVIALWIKLSSPGPVLFRQERVGYRGRRFNCLKFRSMKVNAETTTHESHLDTLMQSGKPMTKLDVAGDPRLIRGGALMRATGLDELPQLLNVIRGEMSIVGPRPCTDREFRKNPAWRQERLHTLPGLTGYWQVNGKNRTTFQEMIRLDTYYVKNQSPLLDLSIMLKTVPALLGQLSDSRNAKNGKAHKPKGTSAANSGRKSH